MHLALSSPFSLSFSHPIPPHPHNLQPTHRLSGTQQRTAVQQVVTSKLLPALGAFGADWLGVAFTTLGQATRLTGGACVCVQGVCVECECGWVCRVCGGGCTGGGVWRLQGGCWCCICCAHTHITCAQSTPTQEYIACCGAGSTPSPPKTLPPLCSVCCSCMSGNVARWAC